MSTAVHTKVIKATMPPPPPPPIKRCRGRPRRIKEVDHPPPTEKPSHNHHHHDLVLEVIVKNLPPHIRDKLTVKQISQLIGGCQVRLIKKPDIIDISSDGEGGHLVGISVEPKKPNQFTCKKCKQSFTWRPNEDYLKSKHDKQVNIKGQAPPRYPELQFKMKCNCSQV